MSTCSTATSTHRGKESRRRRRRRSPSSEAVRGHLEMRLQDLERDWDAYKTGRSGAPRHRRSRSASGLPSSSAVTAAEPADGFHLSLARRSPSPRARRLVLVSALQQTGSADVVVPAAGACDNEGASSVCSVGGVAMATYSSSCSCPSQCAAVVCCGGYSTSSSSSCAAGGTTVPLFSSDINGGRARKKKMDEGKRAVSSRAVWISGAIALVVVAVGFVGMIILELGVDEGRVEYQVPT